jgi:phytoene dehydrogenase-like protein
MSKRIVIIGGGLGGLSAGVSCAQAGFDVTLFEKQSRTGGYAVSFSRNGFIFDPSLHAAPAAGKGQAFETLLAGLGIAGEIDFLKINRGFLARIGPRSFEIPTDFNNLKDALSGAFPSERHGLSRFHADIMRHAPLYYETVEGMLSPLSIATRFVPKVPSFLYHAGTSTQEYLSRFISDPVLRTILYHPAIFYGIPMQRFPAVNFMIMYYLLFVKGMYTIKGGGSMLSSVLHNRLAGLGGRIFTGIEVTKIKIVHGRAAAVLTADGTETAADAVIANVNTPALVHALVGDELVPARYARTLASLRPSLSLLQLHIGLDCPLAATGISNHITTVFPDADLDKCLCGRETDLVPGGFSIIAPTVSDDGAATPGKSVISVLGGVSSAKWQALPESVYREEKKRSIEDLLCKIDKLYPAVRSHCAVIDCATPRTFERYTGNPGGAILGFDCSLGAHRKIMKVSHVPIRNVYCASAWTDRLGGYMQVVKAGIVAAEKCVNKIDKR